MKRNIHYPTFNFLCGTNIDNLIAFKNTSDFKHYRSKCKLKYGTDFYSPKNSSEAFEIFQKYRVGTKYWKVKKGQTHNLLAIIQDLSQLHLRKGLKLSHFRIQIKDYRTL